MRPEYVARFYSEGLNAYNANKEVLSGIETVAKMYKSSRFFICEKVKRFREEIHSYIWDKQDKPKKENDDVMDAIRYAIHTHENNKVEINTFRHSL